MSPDMVRDGTLVWSGEHWINYIRREGETSDSGMVSLYHTRYSPSGEGNTAFVEIPGEAGFKALCTDNREIAAFILDTMVRGRPTPFDQDMPVIDAKFHRGGDVRKDPSWEIDGGGHRVISTWRVTGPPTIMYGPVGDPGREIFSLLFFTDETLLTVDGRPIEGKPYARDIWRSSLGGDCSSCVFALAETTIRVE